MKISGKVKASSAAAAVSTVVIGIVAPHVFRGTGTPSDVQGLFEAVISGGVTFATGYLAKHGIDAEKVVDDVEDFADDLGIPFSAQSDAEVLPDTEGDAVATPVV